MIASTIRALRLGLRPIGRRPLAPLVGVVTLGLGIGATLTVFALTNALFLRPLAGVEAPETLVRIEQQGAASWPNFRDLASASRELAGTAAFSDHLMEVETAGVPRQSLGLLASEGYFEVLGVRPALGRLQLGESGIVVSHRLWRHELGGTSGALGRRVWVNGVALPVVGVAPEGFIGTFRGFQVDLWVAADLAPVVVPALSIQDRGLDRLEMLGRMAPGASRARVAEEVETLAAGLRRDHPVVNRDYRAAVQPLTGWDEELRRPLLGLVGILTFLASLVLLVAVANVTGLLFARLDERRRELAVHGALGASPSSLAALTLGEPLVLSGVGALAGLGVAALGGRSWLLFQPSLPVPVALSLGVDYRVAAVAAGCAGLVALLAAIPSIIRTRRADPGEALKGRARGVDATGSRTRRLLVVGQVAVSVLLLMVAALCVRAIDRAVTADLGFTVDGVTAATLVDLTVLGLDPPSATARFGESLERLRSDPVVAGAGASTALPLLTAARTSVGREGAEEISVSATTAAVDPGFFATLEIPLVDGRGFRTDDDAMGTRVAVVDQGLAERLWPEEPAPGRRLRVADEAVEVVGVVRSLRRPGGRPAASVVYLPLTQHPSTRVHLFARGANQVAVTERIQEEVRGLVPSGASPPVGPLVDVLGIILLPQKIAAAVAGTLGVLAIGLAGVGLYALMALLVAQGRRELAVRLALGASPGSLFRHVAGRGLALALVGLAVGLLLGGGAGRILRGFLHGVGPVDPAVLALPTIVVGLAALFAVWLPARHAARTDPMKTLRED